MQQLNWNRALIATFRELAMQVVPEKRDHDLPSVVSLPESNYAMQNALQEQEWHGASGGGSRY